MARLIRCVGSPHTGVQVIDLLDGCTSSDKMTSIGSILIIENIEIMFSLVTLRINPRERVGKCTGLL